MARERPNASNAVPPSQRILGGIPPVVLTGLTPAEVRAGRRSAPLTRDEFKALRRLAELGVSPLPRA